MSLDAIEYDSAGRGEGSRILGRRKEQLARCHGLTPALYVLGALLATVTCGEEATGPIPEEPPRVGSIQVSLTVTGETPEPNGPTVSVDDGERNAIDYGGSVLFTGIDIGPHVVVLSDLPTNCATTNQNPHSVSVNQNQTTHTGFSVACEAGTAQAPEPYLYVDKIAVGVPIDGSESVKVTAEDADGQDDGWSVTSADESIVTVAKVPPDQVTLTAVTPGQVDVTITSDAGLSRTVEVVVYEPKVLSVNDGELLITYADTFELRLQTTGFNELWSSARFWHPVTDTAEGWYALGSLGEGPISLRGYSALPDGSSLSDHWMIVVKDGSGSALAPPDSFIMEHHWHEDQFSLDGMHNRYFGTFWTPVCPDGYEALGTVVTADTARVEASVYWYEGHWVEPSTDDVRCVKSSLTAAGRPVTAGYDFYSSVGSSIGNGRELALMADESEYWLNYGGIGPFERGSFRAWRVTTPQWDDPIDANAYLETGTFIAIGAGHTDTTTGQVVSGTTGCTDGYPDAHGVDYDSLSHYQQQPLPGSCWDPQVTVDNQMARVLAVELPMLVDRDVNALPSLRNFDEPPEVTEPTVAKAMLLPFTLLLKGFEGRTSEIYDKREDYRSDSPFLVLEKVVQYRLFENWFRVNTGAAYSDDNITYTTGTTTTATTSMSHSAGVSVSVETGLSFFGSGTKVTATASYEFGYETTRSREVFQSREVSFSFHCPAYHACACWSGYTRLIVSKLLPSGGARAVNELDYRSGYRYTATYPFTQP